MFKHPDVLAISVCLSSLSHLPVHFSFRLSRLHGIKITQRKAENQIKMAKMIMMNELNKRANLLIEQLEVITFSPSPSFQTHSSPNIQLTVDVVVMERAELNVFRANHAK